MTTIQPTSDELNVPTQNAQNIVHPQSDVYPENQQPPSENQSIDFQPINPVQPSVSPQQVNQQTPAAAALKKSTKKWVFASAGFSVLAAIFGLFIHYAVTIAPPDYSQTYLHEGASYSIEVPEFLQKADGGENADTMFINGKDLPHSTTALYIDSYSSSSFMSMNTLQQKKSVEAHAEELKKAYSSLPANRELVDLKQELYDHGSAAYALESIVSFSGDQNGYYIAHSLFFRDGTLYLLELESISTDNPPVEEMKNIVNSFERK